MSQNVKLSLNTSVANLPVIRIRVHRFANSHPDPT